MEHKHLSVALFKANLNLDNSLKNPQMIPQNWPRTLQNWGKILLQVNTPRKSQGLFICSKIFTELLLCTTSPAKCERHSREQPDRVLLCKADHVGAENRDSCGLSPLLIPGLWNVISPFPCRPPPLRCLLAGSTVQLANSCSSSLRGCLSDSPDCVRALFSSHNAATLLLCNTCNGCNFTFICVIIWFCTFLSVLGNPRGQRLKATRPF